MANPMGGFWARMTPRERNLILVLILTAFGMGTAVLFYLRSGSLSDTEQEITRLQQALETTYTRGTIYKTRLEEKKAREKSISAEPVLWASLVEDAARVGEGIEVAQQEELGAVPLGDGLLKRTYKFGLANITLENLMKFLTKIESEPGKIILTEQLRVRSHDRTQDRLQVDVVLATWERPTAAPGAEGEEGGDEAAAGGEAGR